jgi:hypothetical protein
MKKTFWQQVMPHLVSIAIFLIVALLFCKPALESDTVMKQSDITNWEGMAHQSFLYKEKHGRFPLWTPAMYSGMPAYQIAMDGPWTPLGVVNTILQLGLPKPINIFFLASVCFYFLCMCLRIRPWVAVIGGIAFAYCTTFPQFITAGHDTQMLALACSPAVLGGILLLFDKKYISGFIITALFTGLQIQQGHQQVSYYLFIVAGIMTLFLLIHAWRTGKAAPMAKGIGLAVAAGILGVAINAVSLLTVYDYSKESKRAGQLVLDDKQKTNEVIKNDKTKGLSKEYAFQWSYGWTESLTLMFPGVMGYGTHYAERDNEPYIFPKLDENSNLAKYLSEKLNLPEEQAANFATNNSTALYWGDQPFTVGPIYIGAVICLLFIFAMVYLEGPHKWWILTAAILGVLLALGKHFPALNYFLFDNFPLYNKFRVPTMALEITQLVVPIGVVLALEKLVANPVVDKKKMQLTAIITAAVFVVAAGLYFTLDYSNENKQRTAAINQAFTPQNPNLMASLDSINRRFEPLHDNKLYENFLYQTKGDVATSRGMITAIREDRQQAFGSTLMRSLVFVLIAMAIGFLFIKKKINAVMMLGGLGLLTAIDLISIDSKYLNSFSFDSKEKYEASEFPLTPADQAILKDTDPNFRVLNKSVGNPYIEDSRTSYYHKSIGGYHPARLGIYDDLIQYQLGGSPNPGILNMLNTKYFIEQNQQGNAVEAVPNPNALGNCWFVNSVKYVHGPREEMRALNNFNPTGEAIVDDSFKPVLSGAITPPDSTSTIKQVAFDNEAIKYESNTSGSHLAVFSEIFYKDWKAYIDGKPAPYAKANYVLRAMIIPAGKHTIEFKFEPNVYYTGSAITAVSAWILTLLILGYIVWLIRPYLNKNKPAVQGIKG